MKAGDILLVKFPFSDLENSKKRPALFICQNSASEKVTVVTIAMITSRMEGLKFPGDCQVKDWQACGLLHPSLIRLAKIAAIDKELVDKNLGQLSAKDLKSVKAAFRKHFKSWL